MVGSGGMQCNHPGGNPKSLSRQLDFVWEGRAAGGGREHTGVARELELESTANHV